MSTNEFELIVNTVDIASKVNIHSCSVYEYLKDLPYEPPVEIIALISKFYLSKTHNNDAVNPIIRSSIPNSCSLSNPIPTDTSGAGCCSENSLLNIGQFIAESLIIAILIGDIYAWYSYIIKDSGWGLVAGIFGLLGVVWYLSHIRIYLRDVNRIIFTQIRDVDSRVLSLNNIFDSTPSIKFYIEGKHTSTTGSGRNRSRKTVVTFRKTEYLRLNNCETLIEPNIYNELEEYRSCCYHFEYDVLLHFDDEIDRLKYINLCKQFINNNIHDVRQSFMAQIKYNMLGMRHWITSDDHHGYIIIINCKPNIYINIFKIITALCTILCVSWLYKLPFYCLMKRKQLTITKYLSIQGLQYNKI